MGKLHNEETQNLLDDLFKKKVKDSLLGFDLEDLSICKSKVVVKDCAKCSRSFNVKDRGLQEDNVALFWRLCGQSNSCSTYCAGHDKNYDPKVMVPYQFCYNEKSVSLIEKAIRKSDSIRALSRAYNSVLKLCARRIQHHKKS